MMSSPRAEGWVPRGRSRGEKQECRLGESRKRLRVRQLGVKEGVRYSDANSILVFKRQVLLMLNMLPGLKCRTLQPRSQALETAKISEPSIRYGEWRSYCAEALKSSVSHGHGDNMLRRSIEGQDSTCPIGALGDF